MVTIAKEMVGRRRIESRMVWILGVIFLFLLCFFGLFLFLGMSACLSETEVEGLKRQKSYHPVQGMRERSEL
jgi:hypothetical protein